MVQNKITTEDATTREEKATTTKKRESVQGKEDYGVKIAVKVASQEEWISLTDLGRGGRVKQRVKGQIPPNPVKGTNGSKTKAEQKKQAIRAGGKQPHAFQKG